METVYTYCAAIGAALLAGQFLLSLIGLGGHGDLDGGHDVDFHGVDFHGDAAGLNADSHAEHFDHGGHWFLSLLSFRAIVAALAVFGLVGLGLDRQFGSQKPAATLLLSLAAGGGMMYAVAWMMHALYGLRSDGTVRIERTVGLPGSAYLTIPGNKSGVGKVTVKVQDRIMEYSAMTSGHEIPTGTSVVVLGVLTPGTLEVARPETVSQLTVEGSAHV